MVVVHKPLLDSETFAAADALFRLGDVGKRTADRDPDVPADGAAAVRRLVVQVQCRRPRCKLRTRQAVRRRRTVALCRGADGGMPRTSCFVLYMYITEPLLRTSSAELSYIRISGE